MKVVNERRVERRYIESDIALALQGAISAQKDIPILK